MTDDKVGWLPDIPIQHSPLLPPLPIQQTAVLMGKPLRYSRRVTELLWLCVGILGVMVTAIGGLGLAWVAWLLIRLWT